MPLMDNQIPFCWDASGTPTSASRAREYSSLPTAALAAWTYKEGALFAGLPLTSSLSGELQIGGPEGVKVWLSSADSSSLLVLAEKINFLALFGDPSVGVPALDLTDPVSFYEVSAEKFKSTADIKEVVLSGSLNVGAPTSLVAGLSVSYGGARLAIEEVDGKYRAAEATLWKV